MENIEIKSEAYHHTIEMRCQGMCKGSCSCPTGLCACKVYEPGDIDVQSDLPPVESFT